MWRICSKNYRRIFAVVFLLFIFAAICNTNLHNCFVQKVLSLNINFHCYDSCYKSCFSFIYFKEPIAITLKLKINWFVLLLLFSNFKKFLFDTYFELIFSAEYMLWSSIGQTHSFDCNVVVVTWQLYRGIYINNI